MNWLIYHIASGHAFFTGIGLIFVAVVCSLFRRYAIIRGLGFVTCVVGAVAIVISSTAIPYWYYGVAVVVTAGWAVSLLMIQRRVWGAVAVFATWMVAAAMELPYHRMPELHVAASRAMIVIGDSVTAGTGEKFDTWPALLARQHNLKIQDISQPGETAASALTRASAAPIDAPVVLLEIGGNDLLRSSPPDQFARDLEALLAHVSSPGRQVVMLELPLPPLSHEYGRIQRMLAQKYKVALVPKRVFMAVLSANGATVDSIHLSKIGQQRMAASIWEIVSPAFAAP